MYCKHKQTELKNYFFKNFGLHKEQQIHLYTVSQTWGLKNIIFIVLQKNQWLFHIWMPGQS